MASPHPPEEAAGRRFDAWLVGAAVLVVGWRLTVLWRVARAGDPVVVAPLLLTGLGLLFVACGLGVAWGTRDADRRLFAAFCLTAGLHWGGPLDLGAGAVRAALVYGYMLLSGLLSSAFFLHLGLRFPGRSTVADRRWMAVVLYGPVVVALLLAVSALAGPSKAAAQGAFFAVHGAITNLFPAAVLVMYVGHLLRPGLCLEERRAVVWMIAGMLVAWVPYLVASTIGEDTDLPNLTMAALPVAFAAALRRLRPRREAG